MKQELVPVEVGQIWVDRDPRMSGRRVQVFQVLPDIGEVRYRQVVGIYNLPEVRIFKSKYARFQRAFRKLDNSF